MKPFCSIVKLAGEGLMGHAGEYSPKEINITRLDCCLNYICFIQAIFSCIFAA